MAENLKVQPTRSGAPGFAEWINDFVEKHNALVELVESKQDKRVSKTGSSSK